MLAGGSYVIYNQVHYLEYNSSEITLERQTYRGLHKLNLAMGSGVVIFRGCAELRAPKFISALFFNRFVRDVGIGLLQLNIIYEGQ